MMNELILLTTSKTKRLELIHTATHTSLTHTDHTDQCSLTHRDHSVVEVIKDQTNAPTAVRLKFDCTHRNHWSHRKTTANLPIKTTLFVQY